MNWGTVCCLAFAAVFALIGALFAALRGRAAMLVSGFNTLPPSKRAQYDTAKLSRAYRNLFLCWTALFAAGALASVWVHEGAAVAAVVVWLTWLGRTVRWDAEKAFAPYRK
ncbi:MAG: DUF3784 domain-containing protein [Eubacteriales bacterium]|nr:DUF3784 domain-containing protein [Eubacteriales bacterium]